MKPDWSDSLKKLYNSVVEEPVPDSFLDLLSKLDQPAPGGCQDSDMRRR